MADILSQIAAYKTREVAERRAVVLLADLERQAAASSPPRGFRVALERACRPGRPALIAEIKKASPSKGLIRADFDPPALAKACESGGAACLSVLTDGPSFQGANAFLTAARDATALPCLRKDFLIDPWQVVESRALGADAVLVILAMTDDFVNRDLISEATRLGMDVLVETHDAAELERATDLGARLIGINNRDLKTFQTDLSAALELIAAAPGHALLVTESGIDSAADAARLGTAGARAMLVGESLMRAADVAAAVRALVGG